MKTQIISKIFALCTLSIQAEAEEIRIFCTDIERHSITQEFTLDMQSERIFHDQYADSNYISKILVWNRNLIAWAQISEGEENLHFVETFYLSRPFLLLSHYNYFNDDDVFSQPLGSFHYRCTRALSDEDQSDLSQRIPQEQILSEEEIRQYTATWGAQIMARIERNRPSVSGRGQVTLSLKVSRNGDLLAVNVIRTSGDVLLDEAAISAVRAATPYPEAPEALSNDSYSFSIPIRFR